MAERTLRSVPRDSKLVVGLVSGAEFVNHMYLVLLPPILGLLAADFHASLAVLGLAMGVQRLSTTVFQLPFGYVADTHGRVLSLGLAIWLGTAGVLLVAAAPSTPVLFVGVAVIGVGIAGHHPSHYPLLSGAVPESVRGRAFSVRGFAGALGFGTPAALVTAVLAVPGTTWRHAVALVGVLGLAYSVVAYLALRRLTDDADAPPADRKAPPSASKRDRVIDELRAALASPPVLAVALLSFVWAVASNGVTAYVVVMLTDGYGLDLDVANLTLAGMFAAGAVMALVGGVLTDRYSAGSVLVTTLGLASILLVAFASLVLPATHVVPLVLTLGGVRMAGGASRSKLVDAFSDDDALGRSFAVMTVGMMLGGAVGPSLFGALIETVGLRVSFLGMAAVSLLALALAVAVVVAYDDSLSVVGRLPRA